MLGLIPERDGSVLVFRPTEVSRDGYIVFEAVARDIDGYDGCPHIFRFEVLHNPETGAWQFLDDPTVVTVGTKVLAGDPFLSNDCARDA